MALLYHLLVICLYFCGASHGKEMNIGLFNQLRSNSRNVSHYAQLIRNEIKNEESFKEDPRSLQDKNNAEKLKEPLKKEPIKFDKKKFSLKSDIPTRKSILFFSSNTIFILKPLLLTLNISASFCALNKTCAEYPSQNGLGSPSYSPTQKTNVPSNRPTFLDLYAPFVTSPSSTPSLSPPVESPIYRSPTVTDNPSNKPTSLKTKVEPLPSNEPTVHITELTTKKTSIPSTNPTTSFPSQKPTYRPTTSPTTEEPTILITNNPSLSPSNKMKDELSAFIHAKYSAIIGIRLNRRQLDILNSEKNINHRLNNIQNSKIMLLNSQNSIQSKSNNFPQKILDCTVEVICKQLLKQTDLEFPFILGTINPISSELVVQCATSQEFKENTPLSNNHNVDHDTTIMFIDKPSKSIQLVDRAQTLNRYSNNQYSTIDCKVKKCEVDYMEIITQISIERIGSKIMLPSEQSSYDTGEEDDTCCKTESTQLIEKEINKAITNGIMNGSLQKIMSVKYNWIVEASPLDQEMNIFPDFLSKLNEVSIDDSHGIKSLNDDFNLTTMGKQKHKYAKKLEINSVFDGGIREFGIFLFISTLMLGTLLTFIGRHKKFVSQKETLRIKSNRGGLTTEEGVELMLEKGSFEKLSNTSF